MQPIEELRDRIDLIVEAPVWEAQQLGLEIREPRSRDGKVELACFDGDRAHAHACDLFHLGADRDDGLALPLQLLRQRRAGAGVLDQDRDRLVRRVETRSLTFEGRVVEASAKDVLQVYGRSGHDPGGADRKVAVAARLLRRIPRLDRELANGARRQRLIALEPLALDHGTAFGDGRLLVLRGKDVGAEGDLEALQDLKGLTSRVKGGLWLPREGGAIADADHLSPVGDRRQVQVYPPILGFEQMADEVVDVQALHHDHDRAGALVVEPGQQRVAEPVDRETASSGFWGSSITMRSPPRPVRLPPTEVAKRDPRSVVRISSSVSFLRSITVARKISRYHGARITARKSAECLAARSVA